jgi:hypothetical protein
VNRYHDVSPNDPKLLGRFPSRFRWCVRAVTVQRLHDRSLRQQFRPVTLSNQHQRSIAICQSAALCSAFGSAVMYSAASRSVSNSRPSGRMIGS